ncbi:hypothetical protein CR492_17960 [Methylocella silvestris]|uniref:Uncharacterized protein n=1 Tax=Methylocella silvestris TaxID=199596 RepID=A0A2J7TCQ9_METSI|nr:hypothetical protein CR492_17960 [Methylocella silvestris]
MQTRRDPGACFRICGGYFMRQCCCLLDGRLFGSLDRMSFESNSVAKARRPTEEYFNGDI